MNKIIVEIKANAPLFIEADANTFGLVFASMSSDEQVAVFTAMAEHMRPHRTQWDYIAIEFEKPEHAFARSELYRAIVPDVVETPEPQEHLRGAVEEALTILLHNPDAAQPPRYRNIQASKILKAALAAPTLEGGR